MAGVRGKFGSALAGIGLVVVVLAAPGCASGARGPDARLVPDALAGRLQSVLEAGVHDAGIAGASVAVHSVP